MHHDLRISRGSGTFPQQQPSSTLQSRRIRQRPQPWRSMRHVPREGPACISTSPDTVVVVLSVSSCLKLKDVGTRYSSIPCTAFFLAKPFDSAHVIALFTIDLHGTCGENSGENTWPRNMVIETKASQTHHTQPNTRPNQVPVAVGIQFSIRQELFQRPPGSNKEKSILGTLAKTFAYGVLLNVHPRNIDIHCIHAHIIRIKKPSQLLT